MLPTLAEFLQKPWPRNSYVEFPEFDSLYVRKGDLCIRISGVSYRGVGIITIANVTAENPGHGAWGRLVSHLVALGYGVYVENAHNQGFADKLKRTGFIPVNVDHGPNFLFNCEGHLENW